MLNEEHKKPKLLIKYCAVNSCANFRGTTGPKQHMFKIPRNREIAEKWLSFLGIQSTAHGFICNKHFKDEHMNKAKTRLFPNAAPTIWDVSKNIGTADRISFPLSICTTITRAEPELKKSNQNLNIDDDGTDGTTNHIDLMDTMHTFTPPSSPLSPALPSTTAMADTTKIAKRTEKICSNSQCMAKDVQIDRLQAEIRLLKNKLVKVQRKVSYLQRIKRNLDSAFSDMKKQNIINEERCKLLEVHCLKFTLCGKLRSTFFVTLPYILSHSIHSFLFILLGI